MSLLHACGMTSKLSSCIGGCGDELTGLGVCVRSGLCMYRHSEFYLIQHMLHVSLKSVK
uniref:Uncharacterized protein n=1 Tax=Anguilla anguilla TaxID=7936 RepID=A0A0E9U8X2_ANGAN